MTTNQEKLNAMGLIELIMPVNRQTGKNDILVIRASDIFQVTKDERGQATVITPYARYNSINGFDDVVLWWKNSLK